MGIDVEFKKIYCYYYDELSKEAKESVIKWYKEEIDRTASNDEIEEYLTSNGIEFNEDGSLF